MTNAIRSIFASIRGFFRKPPARNQKHAIPEEDRGSSSSVNSARKQKILRGDKDSARDFGAFTRLRDVLDGLPAHFDRIDSAVKSLRKEGEGAQAAILANVGPYLFGNETLAPLTGGASLTNKAFGSLPAFLCTMSTKKNTEHTIFGDMVIFTKLRSTPPRVARLNDKRAEYYCLTYGGDLRSFESGRWLWDNVFIGIVDGEIFPLPFWSTRNSQFRGRKGWVSVPDRRLHYSGFSEHEDPKKFVRELASWFMQAAVNREAAMSIRATRGRRSLTFTIPENRAPEFFSDRIDAVGANGRKVPIYHWVAAHTRKTQNGTASVKMHTRGSRKFTWEGCQITIQTPGLQSAILSEFNAAALTEDESKQAEGSYMTIPLATRQIKASLER